LADTAHRAYPKLLFRPTHASHHKQNLFLSHISLQAAELIIFHVMCGLYIWNLHNQWFSKLFPLVLFITHIQMFIHYILNARAINFIKNCLRIY